ncbi:MAG TPA: glycoside hydrolase family 13 protein [Kineosporiaceae bacterium]|nr:glycoside hydrolase family 13 protein [Kineosporiaceae bacterium]
MATPWWSDAVIYEVYLRSFADSDGDGNGDLGGLRNHLNYLADLGVDALWITPWYPSPFADGGYDVSDYRDIHPMFGTLADADAVLDEAHRLGIRLIIDLVVNHTSDQHPWFQRALRASPGSPDRDRYFFRDGRGAGGELPPNNWISAFGGSAWTRVTEPDGTPGQWYLHLFAPEQPDLDLRNADVVEDIDDVLRFWFDRGVDGVRIDAAPALAKAEGLPDADYGDVPLFVASQWQGNPHWDVDDVHSVLRHWRHIGDGYPGDRVFVAEAVVNGAERLTRYLRPDEMHTAFNFQFLKAGWNPGLRAVIDESIAALASVGAPATWVLGSHDDTRLVTRYGRRVTGARHIADEQGAPSDLALGTRRARAAVLLMLALPGGAYVYQGDELGLPDVEDIPEDLLQDPIWERSGHSVRGRDGCRVPMPWAGDHPPFGFSPDGVRTWLPQPERWRSLTVEAESRDSHSMLTLYRRALRIRRALAGFRTDRFAWRDGPADVLDFERGDGVRCVVNLGGADLTLDAQAELLLASAPLERGVLPADTAAWLRAR